MFSKRRVKKIYLKHLDDLILIMEPHHCYFFLYLQTNYQGVCVYIFCRHICAQVSDTNRIN